VVVDVENINCSLDEKCFLTVGAIGLVCWSRWIEMRSGNFYDAGWFFSFLSLPALYAWYVVFRSVIWGVEWSVDH